MAGAWPSPLLMDFLCSSQASLPVPCAPPVFQTGCQSFEDNMASYFPLKCKKPSRDGSLCWPTRQSPNYNINNRSKHEVMPRSYQLFQTTIDQREETPGMH